MIRFPSKDQVERYVASKLEIEGCSFQQKEEIIEAIAELAAKRLGGEADTERNVELKASFIVEGLQTGVDRSTGEECPNLSRLSLTEEAWNKIVSSTKRVLIACAKSY